MKIEQITHNQLKNYQKGQLIVVENIQIVEDKKTKKITEIYRSAGIVKLVGVWGDWVEWENEDGRSIVERLSHLKKSTKVHVRNN